MTDPLRQALVWLGVGAGHAAALFAAFGMGGVGAEGPVDDGCVIVWISGSGQGAATPAVPPTLVGASPPRPSPAAPPRISPVDTAPLARAVAPLPIAGLSREDATPPAFADRAEPLYPRAARLAGAQGVVRLRLEIAADGSLRGARVIEGSGDASLDRAAVRAAEASSFRPARVGGRPVDAEAEATYRFELR